MSGETAAPQLPPGLTSPPRGGRRRGGGGPRGGSNSASRGAGDGTQRNSRGRGGQRGRGQGRGAGGQEGPRGFGGQLSHEPTANGTSPAAAAAANGTDAVADATKKPAKADIQEEGDEEGDGEICFICASPVVHWAVAPCNHRTCHICALRLRALYKSKSCAHCRTPADHVIFTDDGTKQYQDFTDSEITRKDDNLGIRFEAQEILEDTVLLLRFNCADSSCDVACLGWPDLHRHVKNVHHKIMCDLCTRNKKVFTHEHELFTHNDLRKHQRFGDDNPGAVDQSGFKGHPECGFCKQRFYGDDELYTHCRDKHERCHICDRRSDGRLQEYYANYDSLEVHFRRDHFLCLEQDCLDKKFVVFESELDLKAHQLESHPHGLSKDARRDARRVDMSGFDYRQPHQEPRREGRGRGRGRGRDPNVEAIPQSSAQPLRRDELAYQRQMAIHSAQSVSSRTFGGQLSAAPTAAQAPSRSQEPVTVTATQPRGAARADAFPAESSAPTQQPARELTPQEQARQLRHNAVTERATNLLKGEQAKMAEFKTKVSAYKTGAVNASELIDSFFVLFDTSSVELGKLIRELADIFEIASKKDGLIRAWNEWKAIHEDYPSLPGGSTTTTTTTAATLGVGQQTGGGSRVLRLKSSTAQSSRSAANRQGGWGTAGSVANSFPSLASANASLSRAGGGGGGGGGGARSGTTPWTSASASATPSPQVSRGPSSSTTTTNAARKTPAAAATASDAFPALPAAAKPTSTLFMPGSSGAGVRRVNSPAVGGVNAWGGGGGVAAGPARSASSSGGTQTPVDGGEESATGNRKKGGNKNKKQTLFHFG
ncbi:hypothetical protein EJ05DRAFT_475487 [Pseudovirgaria hyperparasitica]|uniref:RING-type E3 ubiquitin transferase n=1 Tax=Pseudovirgaria hyperparasitica TaxID=470096 RepID=A0A6A6WB51_9PEZI|nr:uncharacterized protein EJ05DRAFT_475487 [Pseudovirgaria hyperparasitica]KAF2759264.1 hypothetical protein EJ05DRAFT_475487 [Pseudovirgaria hyperparasitica]